MRSILLAAIFCVSSFFAKAQDPKGIIQGTLVDSASAAPISYATISIFKSRDTVLVSYRLSDDKGAFRVTNLPTDVALRMVISFTGFTIYRKEFTLRSDQPSSDIGKLLLKTSSINVNEVTITAERPPVVVRKDTIEFNAASFKTLPDALVEDLLRKLPGVNVDKDGNILVNGRRVSTIFVDGKEFFGGDVRIASKNLPANTIDKVQVTDDKEVLKFNPLMPEADIPQVINLKLKPGIKKGMFGKAYAGGGIRDKVELGALLNIFRDTTQVSILGYGNNLNKAAFAFTDIKSVGGFGRGGWGNATGNGNGGLSIDKVSFGGFGNGLMKSTGGGANFNTIISKKVQFNLTYFYGAVISDYDELRNTRQLNNGTLFTTSQAMTQHGNQYAHLIGTKVGFDVNPKLRIDFRPQVTLYKENTGQFTDIQSTSSTTGLLNTSGNDQQNRNTGATLLTWLTLTKSFDKKGRTFVVNNWVNADNTKNRLFNLVESQFYSPASQSTLDQLRNNEVLTLSTNTQIRYSDLFGKSVSFSSAANFLYFKNENDLATYFPDTFGDYVVGVPALTQNFDRNGLRVDVTASMRWKINSKWTLGTGLGFGSFDAKSTFTGSAPIAQHFTFLLPTLDLTRGILNLSYSPSFREPAIGNIQPVINNTNPLFIRRGNPDLKPAITHSLSLSLRKYDTKRLMTYNFNVGAAPVENATIISRTIDGAGVQTTIPINTNGTWNTYNNLSFQKDWKMADNRQVSVIASNSTGFNSSFVQVNQVKSRFGTFSIRPSAEIRINLNDKFELNQAYGFSHVRINYTNNDFKGQVLNYQDSRSELIYRAGAHFVFETQLDYRFNANAVPGLTPDYYKWNAAVTYVFLKGNRGQLKFAVNDILDQNILASRTVRENLVEDMQGSTIRRYGLLTFTYNIRSFGEKVGGRNQLFRF